MSLTDLEREAFRQANGNLINDLCRLGAAVMAQAPTVCRDHACPIIGLHNTDECLDLIEQAKAEGQL